MNKILTASEIKEMEIIKAFRIGLEMENITQESK